MASASKKRKHDRILPPPRKPLQNPRTVPSPAAKTERAASFLQSSLVSESYAARTDLKFQQAKKFAVAQAQQDGSTGNFRSFDSLFGNYLIPVTPSHADLI